MKCAYIFETCRYYFILTVARASLEETQYLGRLPLSGDELLRMVTHTEETQYLAQRLPLSGNELLSMVTHTAITATGDCRQPKFSNISLFLYTRSNPMHPIRLQANNVFEVHSRKKTVLLIHGWIASSKTYGFSKLKDEYLRRHDCNVIIVDWSVFAARLYPTSVCFLPKIARLVASFLCAVKNQQKVSLTTVHLVGHSLGGQMSGLIGQYTRGICNENIGRITAMDPAGPLFQGLPNSQRLDKTDANLIDVIHTNKGVLGYFGNCGHVDFYPNCGTIQSGCPNVDVGEAINYPPLAAGCDHWRSVDYMIESINSDRFKATSCKSCPTNCSSDSSNASEAIMGENCSPNTPVGAYVLKTNPEAPFGMGE